MTDTSGNTAVAFNPAVSDANATPSSKSTLPSEIAAGRPNPGSPANPKLSSRFAEFFQENNGNFSATRLAFLLWSLGVFVVWSIVSIRVQALQTPPPEVMEIIGILMTGKVVQKFGEPPGTP